MKNLEKFLEFDGKRIAIVMADGTWWVAIKPICEVLNVDYIQAFKNLKEDEIVGQLLCNHTIVAADKKYREMLCLPEKYIYGWLFSLRSESKELKAYKLKCYDILYKHFHGAITSRINTLAEKAKVELEMLNLQDKIDADLEQNEAHQRVQDLKKYKKQLDKSLKEQDADLMSGQLSISV